MPGRQSGMGFDGYRISMWNEARRKTQKKEGCAENCWVRVLEAEIGLELRLGGRFGGQRVCVQECWGGWANSDDEGVGGLLWR